MDACGDTRWNIRVSGDDDRLLHDLMVKRSRLTGETVTQTGTIKRAVRELWDRECGDDA